jgi:hypothetical protein
VTRFQLVILDSTHMILTTKELLKQEQVIAARTAFEWWKDNGGAIIIGDCDIVNREVINIDLDLGVADVRADITSRALGAPGAGPGESTPSPRPSGVRGFLRSKADKE